MSSFLELKGTIDKLGEAWEEYKKTNDERLKAELAGNTTRVGELDQKLAKIEKNVSGFDQLKKDIEFAIGEHQSRLEELEAKGKRPNATASEQRELDYKTAFLDWIRHPRDPEKEFKASEARKRIVEAKDLSADIMSGSGGGFAVPKEIGTEIERLEMKFSPVRRLVKVVQVGTTDYRELVNVRGASSGWVGETDTRNKTNTPKLREAQPTFGELYSYPQASEWSLDDIFFNVASWLTEEIAQDFALQEGEAVIRGDGSSKPTGMLQTVPTDDPDFASPLRNAKAYQYVEQPGSPPDLGDGIIDLMYAVNSTYRSQGTFVMNSVSAGIVRKLKDKQGQYLWTPGLAAGQADRLLGMPLEVWEQMDNFTKAGSPSDKMFPIAFGNFRRGYLLVDRVGLRITRDDVTSVGFVKFYVRRREGGIVLNNDAVKFLRTQ